IPTGLKEGLIDTDGLLVDFGIKKIFDEILDPFLTEMIESKLKQIAPIQSAFFELKDPEMIDGKFASPEYRSNILSTEYMDSMRNHLFMKTSTFDGIRGITYYNEHEVLFDTKEDALNNGYHMQLLKAAVIDQQLNTFVANTLVRKMTWDFSTFDDAANWNSFKQILGKRESAYNSPFIS